MGAFFLVLLVSLSLFVDSREKFEYFCLASISDDFYFLRCNLKNILEQCNSFLRSLLGIDVNNEWQVSPLKMCLYEDVDRYIHNSVTSNAHCHRLKHTGGYDFNLGVGSLQLLQNFRESHREGLFVILLLESIKDVFK